MTTLIKLEIARALRNKMFLFFSVIYPSALYLLIAGRADHTPMPGTTLDMGLYFMVSMASFGAMTAVLLGNSERIAKERANGWVRQLRLTALPGRGYVAAKMGAAAAISLPTIVLVMIVAAVVNGVRLEAWQWLAVLACTWLGSFAFAALGVAIGYLANADTVRPISMLVYFGLSFLGGLWMPLTVLPKWAQDIAEWVPSNAYAALGRAVEAGSAPHVKDIAILLGYLVVFAGAAAWLYRKDTRKA
ncbi:ABC transporter permease [Streptomyces sp. MST-110588]|uniref:ABC transporter permease n=1 Tax=Streptomyces sp. MST-110588 TaxID=2833628 RepID=UPI001F5DA435|nr:ABC transporter permease [Streptomyces sp. MST-110588]UNO40087.1 ABC transporter permease [Streptomyces sp. MST-110588]